MLFREGQGFSVPPYRVLFQVRPGEDSPPVQAAFSVPVAGFRLAVERNRIKRLTREAWRLQKQALYAELEARELRLLVFLVYTGKKIPAFQTVRDKISVVLNRLISELPSAGPGRNAIR